MNNSEIITSNTREFLQFLKGRFPLFHNSNIFFRDIHYGTLAYLEKQGKRMNYVAAEDVARQAIADLEKQGILKRIDSQSWVLLYPEFALPRVQKAETKAS